MYPLGVVHGVGAIATFAVEGWRPKVSPMKSIAALCAFLLFGAAAARAQGQLPGRLEGRVLDATDKQPLPGASIVVGTVAATADEGGHYALSLPEGEYTLRSSFIGHAEKSMRTEVRAGETTVVDVLLEAVPAQLDIVVVSAGRFEQKVGEVTQSLSVLPAQIIRDRATVNLADALDQVPGVVVIDGDPQIRAGSGFSYGAGSRVMMLVDDLPILSGDIGRPNWTFLPIEDVAQVEVIKGASSVLYGSAALSGVINVRTAWPLEQPRTRATVLAGTYDAPGSARAKWWHHGAPVLGGASFMHAQRYNKLDLVLGGNAYADQGYIGPERIAPDSLSRDPFRLNDAAYERRARFNFAARWRNQRIKGLNYGLAGNAMKSRSTSVFLWDDLDRGLYRPAPGTTTFTEGTQLYLDPFVNYTGEKGTRHTLRGRWFHRQFDNTGGQGNGNDMLFGEYQLQQKLDWAGPLVATAGITGQQVQSHAELYSANPAGDGENTANNVAAYLQLDKKWLEERLMLSAGVRYEQFKVNELVQSEPVIRAGATYRVLQGTYVRASYGQGFRFPTIGERYINTSVGSLNIYPNPQLQPETSVNTEFGIKQGFKFGNVSGYVDVVAFRQEFDRYVEFTFGQWGSDKSPANIFGFGFMSVNTGGARITGTEVELAAKGKAGQVELHMLLGYTHTLPVSTTPTEAYASSVSSAGQVEPVSYASTSYYTGENILKFRVQHLFRADVGAAWKRLSGGVSLRYNSHVRNIDKAFGQLAQVPVPNNPLRNIGVEQWMDGHTTGDWISDVRLAFALTPQLKAALLVSNLTNEVYAIRPMAIEAPRSFRIQLALDL